MFANLVNGSYCFSFDLPDIRVTGVAGKLHFRMEVDGKEVIDETYYPDGKGTVTVCDTASILNDCFEHPVLDIGLDKVALPAMVMTVNLADDYTTQEYTLHVIYSRYSVSFGVRSDFLFYSRYHIKRVRQNSIDYLSTYIRDSTTVSIDVLYLSGTSTLKKNVSLQPSSVNCMTAWNMSPVKVAQLAEVPCESILSYDARVTDGTLSDLVRYVIDRQSHREVHQFLYYNAFGLPESISFTGLVQYAPQLDGELSEMTDRKRRINPYVSDLRTLNTGYLDRRKYKALIDMLASPVLRWYDTPTLPVEVVVTDIDFTHTRMGNQRVNVNLTFCPATRRHRVFDRSVFSGGIFDYTFDRTFE